VRHFYPVPNIPTNLPPEVVERETMTMPDRRFGRTPHILPRFLFMPLGIAAHRLLWCLFPNRFTRDWPLLHHLNFPVKKDN
jgi:hypothetical protein